MDESTRRDRQMVKGMLVGFIGLGFVLTGFSHTVVIGGACLGALGFWVLLEALG